MVKESRLQGFLHLCGLPQLCKQAFRGERAGIQPHYLTYVPQANMYIHAAVCLALLLFMASQSSRRRAGCLHLKMASMAVSCNTRQAHKPRYDEVSLQACAIFEFAEALMLSMLCLCMKLGQSGRSALSHSASQDSSDRYREALRAVSRSNSMPRQQSLIGPQPVSDGVRSASRSASRGR